MEIVELIIHGGAILQVRAIVWISRVLDWLYFFGLIVQLSKLPAR